MMIIKKARALQKKIDSFKKRGKRIGFVPTMGFFHEGHLSLMRRARKENDIVVVSLFVNPLQFGPREDLKQYPRSQARDSRLARQESVDFLFCPSVCEMYNEMFQTTVSVEKLSQGLCGASRPGHFEGVTTVVSKLFNIVQPDRAYFGQKDYQQYLIIKRMVTDLVFPCSIHMCPIVREDDGLALSSRNAYLSIHGRARAVVLYHALQGARDAIQAGEKRGAVIVQRMQRMLKKYVDRIEYIAIRNAHDLSKMNQLRGTVFIGIAVCIEGTRLIDNIIVRCK